MRLCHLFLLSWSSELSKVIYVDMAKMLSDNMEAERRQALAESEGGSNVKLPG